MSMKNSIDIIGNRNIVCFQRVLPARETPSATFGCQRAVFVI